MSEKPEKCMNCAQKDKTATLTIYGQLNNLNDYTKACRAHRMAGASMKKRNEQVVSGCIKRQLNGFKVEGKALLYFRWYEPDRRRDPDNVAFAKKFILDALVKNKVIESDGWRGLSGFTDDFYVDPENPRIEIDIMQDGARSV